MTSAKLCQEPFLSGIGNLHELGQKSEDLLQQFIHEIRSLSKQLSASMPGNFKLRDTMRELIDNIAATDCFEMTLDIEGLSKLDVSEKQHLALYRILQEQLTNIMKTC